MVKQSIEIIDNGFKIIKVKLGDNGKKDVERIKLVENVSERISKSELMQIKVGILMKQ